MATNRKYWKGLEELKETPQFLQQKEQEFIINSGVEEFLGDERLKETSTARRDFLKFLGFSVAAATVAACEAPVVKAVPYVNKPENVIPGKATWYASTYYDGVSYANILVKTREGRPIFIKGNKDVGFTKGAVNPQIIASVLSLYDSERLKYASIQGENTPTATVDDAILKGLNAIKAKNGRVVLVSNTLASPSTYAAITALKNSLGSTNEEGVSTGASFEHVQYDAVSYAAIRKANGATIGKAIIPDYDFSKARTIVSFGADFLTSWLLPTQFTPQYIANRNPDNDWMSKHYQFESNMSITGSNADERFMIKPSEEGAIIASLIKACGGSVSGVSGDIPASVSADAITAVAKNLKAGNGLVVSGSNNVGIQTLVNKLNHIIGAYASIININNPINLFQSEDDKMLGLMKGITSGNAPDAVIFYGVNPVYSAPNGTALAEAIGNIGLTISLSQFADETASMCKFVVPDHHALEAWNDFSPKANEYAIAQPTIRPLFDSAAAQESFLVWAGIEQRGGKDSRVVFDFMQKTWASNGFTSETGFDTFWNTTIHNSALSLTAEGPSQPEFNDGGVSDAVKSLPQGGDVEIVLYQKVAIGNGANAANPWLQEMPDPISKVTWDNYITMNPLEMARDEYNMSIDQEHAASTATVTVGEVTLTLPVYPSPGQALNTVGIALGYGRGENGEAIGKTAYQTKEFGGYVTDGSGKKETIGKNAFKLVHTANGTMEYTIAGSVKSNGGTYPIATTQIHQTVMGRNSIVRETTFDIFKNHSKDAYNPAWTLVKIDESGHHVSAPIAEFDLWDAHPVEHIGHRWGMTIDLSSCIGCGSCLVACQSENNVPVVGKDEVRRGREMHWLRLDRYYASDEEATVGQRKDKSTFSFSNAERAAANPKVVHQPMMCHHCNHAPCETVCPVAATTHSNEGLNQMTYNRCIGTRYCANNCPYKVRRFNWFNYPSYKKFTEVNPAQDDLGRMVLNPDVTVRTRGVMEKCSFCVQKIQEGKLTAKKELRPVKDGDVVTACADACPSNAIVVGDWNDVNSMVRSSSSDKRAYQALEEVGVKPNIWYKVKVRNEQNELLAEIQEKTEAKHSHGEHEGHDKHDHETKQGH